MHNVPATAFHYMIALIIIHIQTLVPIVNEMKHICALFGRHALQFDIGLRRPQVMTR
jgi:hypothetical protein